MNKHMSDAAIRSDVARELDAADPLGHFPSEQAPQERVTVSELASQPPPTGPDDRRAPDSEDQWQPGVPKAARPRWAPARSALRDRLISSFSLSSFSLSSKSRVTRRAARRFVRGAWVASVTHASRLGHTCASRGERLGSAAWSWARATRAPSRRLAQAHLAALFLLGVVVGGVLVAATRWPSRDIRSTAAAPDDQLGVRTDDGTATRTSNDFLTQASRDSHGVADPASDSQGSAPAIEEPSIEPARFLGSLQVDSEPPGADVFLNGQHVGITPLLIDDLLVGSRAVRVVLVRHESWSRAVDVVADQRTTVTAALQPTRR